MDEIKKALKDAGLGHLEDDVFVELGFLEAEIIAMNVIEKDRKRKEARNGKDRNESGVRNSEGRR